jgi:hypothetical protein
MTEWRYLKQGKVRHALPFSAARRATCGLELWRGEDWYGTGSQKEYERVAELPKCKNCVKLGAR